MPSQDQALGIQTMFPLGRLMITRGVNDLMANNESFANHIVDSLKRHASGDWGDICDEDKAKNESALEAGGLRLLSAYEKDEGFPKIWILTEWDRSVTTILFPDEY